MAAQARQTVQPAGFSTGEVARLLQLPPARVRALARAGFVTPERGPGRRLRFSFQDVVVLRAARDLVARGVPTRRAARIVGRLRAGLPPGRSLASLRIAADRGQAVVRDGGELWEPESGQRLLDFSLSERAPAAVPIPRRVAAAGEHEPGELGGDDWYERGYELEAIDPDEAVHAYGEALRLDPEHADAHLNLGRLQHERGELASAAEHFRRAVELRPQDPTAAFDLGVALQDLGRLAEAAQAYRSAIRAEPGYADAYFNLSAIFERLGRRALAIRHLKTYRQLVGER